MNQLCWEGTRFRKQLVLLINFKRVLYQVSILDLDPKNWKNVMKAKLNEYRRVLKISSKPDREEFEMSAKITGAGMLIIGIIGFVFYLIANLLPQVFTG